MPSEDGTQKPEDVKIEGAIKPDETAGGAGDADGGEKKDKDPVMEALEALQGSIKGIDDRISNLEKPVEPGAEPEKKEGEEKPEGWKPKTWDDIPAKSEEVAKKVYEEEEKKKEADQIEAEEKKKAFNEEFDRQLAEAETNGFIPAMKNAEDENDPGRVARREVVSMAVSMETLNLKNVSEMWKSLADQGIHFDVKSRKYIRSERTMDGKSAPVASSNTATGESKPQTKYDEIHNARDLHSLVRE